MQWLRRKISFHKWDKFSIEFLAGFVKKECLWGSIFVVLPNLSIENLWNITLYTLSKRYITILNKEISLRFQ